MSMKHPDRYHDHAAKARRRHQAAVKKQRHERRLALAAQKPSVAKTETVAQ